MQILDNIIILTLPVIAFFVGKRISDNYNSSTIDELRYQLRLLSAQHGTGYVAPPIKKQKLMPIGQEFMDRLKTTGKAVQQLPKSDR